MAVAVSERPADRPAADEVGPLWFLRQVWGLVRPYWGRCLLAGAGLLVQICFYLLLPICYKLIFDRAIGQGDLKFLRLLLSGLAGGFVVVTLAELLQGYVSVGLGVRVVNDLRRTMFAHLQKLSISFYTRTQVGDLMSRFTNDLNVIENALQVPLYKIVFHSLFLVASAALLFVIEWRLALLTMAALPLSALGPRLFGSRAMRAGTRRKLEESGVSSLVQENIMAQKVVRAFGLRRVFLDRFEKRLSGLHENSVRMYLFSAFAEKLSSMGILLVQLLVIGVGAYLAVRGLMTAGALVGFVGLLISMGNSASSLTKFMPDLVQAAAGMQRVRELLDEPPEAETADGALPMPSFSEEIRFEDVTFSYTGKEVHLDGVSFSIPAGKTVAFVGRSGSGKSTILNLLTRFYDSSRGRITVDGHDLKQISQDALRARIGPVFQDTFLFNTTVRENIRQGRLDATDEAVEDAARAAEIHAFILGLPDGYDTEVGEMGGYLSGGQKQRIALARAILRNPSILVLDEATSALDPGTEAAVNATLEKLAKDRSIVSVTHRLSSAVNVDRIFVLEKGKLVEQGTHKELLNLKGVYYQMWQDFTLELTQDAIVGEMESVPEQLESAPPSDEAHLAQRLREAEAELQAQQQELQRLRMVSQRWAHLAGTDSLTGLPNKISFLQALVPQEILQAQRGEDPVGFILISGDNLGPINETYGREGGDQVLRGLSSFLQSVLKGEEQLGHIDGTHFAVVFHPANLETARGRAEVLRTQVAEHGFSCAETTVRITISAGAASLESATVGDPKAAVEEVFRKMNGALYLAKKAGGNRVEVVRAHA